MIQKLIDLWRREPIRLLYAALLGAVAVVEAVLGGSVDWQTALELFVIAVVGEIGRSRVSPV